LSERVWQRTLAFRRAGKLSKKGQQIGHCRNAYVLFQALGHHGFAGAGKVVQVGAGDAVFFAVGGDQRDAGAGFAG